MNQSVGNAPFFYTLSNGIRLIHKECYGEVSCCGLVVNAGSRHEQKNEQGLAHFLEHMLFKGTSHRNAANILNNMERVGGELNAYTTKEETFVYTLFLKKDYRRAIELVSDLFFNSTFPEEEIQKEREVILDEINSFEDSPSDLIFDEFDQWLFPANPIGHKILGEPDSLTSYTADSFRAFHQRLYTTDSIVFYSQAAIPAKRVVAMAEHFLGGIPATKRLSPETTQKPEPAKGFYQAVHKETHQAHVICGNAGFSLYEEDRLALYFLNNILGGPGMNSRLNLALREHTGLVYSVESNVTSFTDSGVFSIYFGTDPDQVDRCLSIMNKELRKIREIPFTDRQLSAARQQLFGQILIASENKENQTLGMGKSMLYFNAYDSMEEIIRKIEYITSAKLTEIACQVLDPDKLSLLIYK
ncbi:MAG: pitrilysin family protein [Bacteroidota bacterium]|nr:pitrilysin family protein [Bacteroidota bacterium]